MEVYVVLEEDGIKTNVVKVFADEKKAIAECDKCPAFMYVKKTTIEY